MKSLPVLRKTQSKKKKNLPIVKKVSSDKTLPSADFTKLSRKKELFVLEYTQNGRNEVQAALAAGYPVDDITRTAYRLMQNPKIKQRIDLVYGKTSISSDNIDRNVLNDLYFDAVVAAKRNGNTKDLINAIRGLASLHGLEVNRHEVKNEHTFNLSDLIEDQTFLK